MIGHPRRHYRVTDSTNPRARELAGAGAPHGTLVTAAEQTAGRGRQGRTWTAPAGKALLMSLVVRPVAERHTLLPLAAGLAVSEAVESLAPVSCQIKWPNDVLIGDPPRASARRGGRRSPDSIGRKVAGILIEARPGEGWAVLGIGLNVAIEPHELPEELRETATSIGGGATVEAALAALLASLERWLEAPAAEVVAAYRERDALRGRRIAWAGGSGVAEGIDDRGDLLVATDAGGRAALSSGEVHLAPG